MPDFAGAGRLRKGSEDVDKPVDGHGGHIEIDQLDALVAAAGVNGAREILDAFSRSTEELLALLSAQMNNGDLELAANTAHAIKGMAANVGAACLSSTASDLEIACKDENADAAPGLVRDAHADFEAARGRLLEHLQQAS